MHKILKQSMVLFVVATLIVIPFGSAALAQVEFEKEKPSAGAMFADFVTLRPVGLAAIGACAVVYAVVLPFAIIGGNTKAATERLIVEPWKYTISRPIGVF
ncbi:MAG: hypothetical protein ACYS0I_21690 [Planctomycetota bacterium]